MQDYYIYHTFFLIFMFILGAAFGSFLCCQARRLKLKEEGTKESSKSKSKSLGKRSVCLKCGYKLKWYDNLPILSWLFLKGKCRKCKKSIGLAELFSEIGLGLAFVLVSRSFNLEYITPFSLGEFLFIIITTLSLGFLAIYDGIYGELPNFALYFSLAFAVLLVILRQSSIFIYHGFTFQALFGNLLPILLSALVLAGTYLVLYLVSKGKWVGDGDWLLALTIALVVGSPWLSLLVLFLANFLACLIYFPILKSKKSKLKNAKIYLGPFLVAAFFIVFSFSDFFLSVL